jgi:hypothetical protein
MVFFLVAFGLLLHVLFWGAGLALLATPSRWRNCWPVFCAPAGLALQSAAVWAGSYAGLTGTNAYGRASEFLPLALLALGLWRRRAGAARALRRFGGLGLVMAATLTLLVSPLARASRELTTNSLGSCDAADYAAGARVLQEFARSDREGFLGLTEVVKVASVDNFYDFWLRLNHFTPSALIALNDTVFGLAAYQLTGVLTAVLLVLSLPMAFWMARGVLGYGASVSLWITAIYGLSPLTWYAVAHVAMSQLIAAQAIALVTWAGVALWRGRLSWRRGGEMSGILFIAYWLILGSYNFILLVCLVPAIAYAGGNAVLGGAWRRLARWAGMMAAPLLVCGAVFLERVLGLAERFTLFRQYDFGWRIPALSPEGWLGAVHGTEFEPFGSWVRLVVSLALLALLAAALGRDTRRRGRAVYCAVSLTLPILVGYAYLEARGAVLGTNASYDAYKLFAVFYPGLLAGFCYWTHLFRSRRLPLRIAAGALMALVTLGNFSSAQGFATRMKAPPWTVDARLVELGRIETMPTVASVNVRIPDMWGRLWANALLLRKPQYFYWHTYEGRRDTFLHGEWDLNGGLIQTRLPGAGTVRINDQVALLDTHSPFFVRPRNGDGWYDLEYEPRTDHRWRWTGAAAEIHLESTTQTLHTTWRFLRVHSLAPRDLQVWVAGRRVATLAVGTGFSDLTVPDVTIPAGGAVLELRTDAPLVVPPGDARPLGVQIFGIEITVESR